MTTGPRLPETVTITVAGTPLTVAEPASATGGVVVVQEAFGVTSYIEDVCSRLAATGRLAVGPHLFHRQGDPVFDYDGDLSPVKALMGQLTGDGIAADVDAALEHVAGRGVEPAHTAILGFCMGGSVAMVTATRRALGAAVTFYGGGVREGRFGFPPLVEAAPALRSPWLGLYGDLDGGIPVSDVEALRAAAARSAVPTEVVRYPEAGHGFHCHDRSAYHARSAADAWERALRWLERHAL